MSVALDQVWRDMDKRMGGRLLWITEIEADHVRYSMAYETPSGYRPRQTRGINNRIALRRLRPPFYQKVWPA